MAENNKQKFDTGTKILFIGGVNEDRIGGNSMVVEHTNERNETSRIIMDLGAMFAPYESGFEAAYPNLDKFLDRIDPVTGKESKAEKPVDAMFITHAHEDHIGGLVNYVRMGYQLPVIKTSRFTKNLINIVFNQEGIKAPQMVTVKPGDNILVGEDMVVEPFGSSHSVIEPLGFHTLTFLDGKAHAGIVNYGDLLTAEDVPVGKYAYSREAVNDLLSRKRTTTFLIDSTSITPQKKRRLSFEELVDNSVEAIRRNPDRNIVVSPVISRSFQNIAVDIENARRLNTKICLEGAWLKLVYKAMQFSGYKDFDDVIYKGPLKNYLNDKKISKKYIVCTGAFAQGLKEYQENRCGDVYNIPMAAATKFALGLHRDFGITPGTLILARQRIIDEIDGETGPAMLQMMAAKGAKVIMSPGSRKVANFEEVVMQNSGHLNTEEFAKLVKENQKFAPDAVYIPIHGNPEQCAFTARVARQNGAKTVQALNMDEVKVAQGVAENVAAGAKEPFSWIAVKKIFANPLQPDASVPPEGKMEFWRVDQNYVPLDDKPFYDTSLVRSVKPGDDNYYANHPEIGKMAEMLSDSYEPELRESNKERKAKMSRKDKKKFNAEEKRQQAEKRNGGNRQAERQDSRGAENIMRFVDGMGAEHVKLTKSGKPRKINPLKLRSELKNGNNDR